jgi:8-hydroxy-5-deazaflavin:NADPH oxidoreductase
MKIGMLGSGDVGRKLADGLIEVGHEVKIGTRDPAKEQIVQWVRNHVDRGEKQKASAGSFAEAASFGEMVIIATLWDGTVNAIKMADPAKNLTGKMVIDVTNPLDFSKGIPPKLAVGHTDSAGETVQRLLPDAKVVKTLNIVGNPHMIHPDFPCGPPTMFICGNDHEAKKMVIDSILTPFGWETIDIGGIEGARLLEPLAMLWITYYFRTNNGNHAFKLLMKRKE